MAGEQVLDEFIEARKRFFQELMAKKEEMDELLEAMRSHDASITDIALLEGLHAEKHRLFTDFVKAEDTFVERLLAVMRTKRG
jgi:hypothetical protein